VALAWQREPAEQQPPGGGSFVPFLFVADHTEGVERRGFLTQPALPAERMSEALCPSMDFIATRA
jgi:hypothetical protein